MSLALLAALTVLIALRATTAVDLAVTQALQSAASPPLDLLANANTLFGQATLTIALAALLTLAIRLRGPGPSWLAVGGFGVVLVVGLALKLALVHASPPEQYVRSLWNPFGVEVPTPSSFPSGHVERVTFLALFAAGLARRRWAWVAAIAFVAFTLWARVYIGDHWLSDAIGGLALGAACAFGAVAWLEWCRTRPIDRRRSARGRAPRSDPADLS